MIFRTNSALAATLLAVVSMACFGVSARAEAAPQFDAEQIRFFESSIRPVLAENCLDCHTGTKAKVGLELNHRDGWLRGSDYRPVVNLENPADSLVVHAVSHAPGKDVKPMPYEGERISDESIGNLVRWIEMGLPWPEGEGRPADEADPAKHWSFQPVKPSEVPAGAHLVDHFLDQARYDAGVERSPRADRATLYRRAHFSLLGLPPKYEDVKKFVNDPRPDDVAWAETVRHLLGSPHYGERWARLWMDVARYSDTKGYEAGGRERRFVHSHTYRDWLIRAFNEDLPYDQFVLYQLAAEQLVDWEGPEKHHLAAMGFLSLSKNGRSELIIDDRIDTTFRGLMALTVACARCHDHKADPIPTAEYYSLYSVFANSLEVGMPQIGETKSGPEYDQYLADLAREQKVVDDFLNPKLAEIVKNHPETKGNRGAQMAKLDRAARRELQNKQRVVDKFVADAGMEPDKAIILKQKAKPSGHAVFIRGNPARRGENVQRHFPSVATPGEPVVYESGGRLEMAKDIVRPENPFTARNIVNRVWMWHFGEGIVRSVDDFGLMGEQPDHPELLDHLAHWFVENGSSVKKLHELLLTSQTWQQGAIHPDPIAAAEADPDNRLLWRYDRRRLDLEQMRDALLDVSGNLSNEMYGRPVKILEPPYSNRRSVYAFIDRQNLKPVFRNFDFSNPQETTAQRPRTTIPMQALFTLNSEFVQNQADLLAGQAAKAEDGIAYLHRRVFASDPSESDRQLADSFLTSFSSELDALEARQTATEWSYGWGSVDAETGQVSFTPFPHWTGQRWQIAAEHPLKNDTRSYLYADRGATHPGNTAKESAIYQWRAPESLEIAIRGAVERGSVGKGNGVRILVATGSGGVVFDRVLPASDKQLPVNLPKLSVAKGEVVFFVVDPHENNASFDSVRWSPQVIDLGKTWPKWGLAETFSGPAKPITPWGAYAHALLNTNRFLFLE